MGGRTIHGFTLIELMIAAAILGVLAMIAVPKFADMVIRAKEAVVLGQLGAVRSAYKLYYADTEGVTPDLSGPSSGTDLLLPYLDPMPTIAIPRHNGNSINPGSSLAPIRSTSTACPIRRATNSPGRPSPRVNFAH
jgi:prepilin-type N-terminal cleavage/methylation domain-containing protein